MAAGAQSVGNGKFYLHTTNNGARTSHHCVITAHGIRTVFNRTFRTPDSVTVQFYSSEGSSIRTTTLENEAHGWKIESDVSGIATGTVDPGEPPVIGGSMCSNYELTKIQKSTSGCMGGKPTNWMMDRVDVSYADISAFLNHFPHACDILSIRHRPLKMDPTLQDAVTLLRNLGYTDVHCAFCRAPLLWGTKPITDLTGALPG